MRYLALGGGGTSAGRSTAAVPGMPAAGAGGCWGQREAQHQQGDA